MCTRAVTCAHVRVSTRWALLTPSVSSQGGSNAQAHQGQGVSSRERATGQTEQRGHTGLGWSQSRPQACEHPKRGTWRGLSVLETFNSLEKKQIFRVRSSQAPVGRYFSRARRCLHFLLWSWSGGGGEGQAFCLTVVWVGCLAHRAHYTWHWDIAGTGICLSPTPIAWFYHLCAWDASVRSNGVGIPVVWPGVLNLLTSAPPWVHRPFPMWDHLGPMAKDRASLGV